MVVYYVIGAVFLVGEFVANVAAMGDDTACGGLVAAVGAVPGGEEEDEDCDAVAAAGEKSGAVAVPLRLLLRASFGLPGPDESGPPYRKMILPCSCIPCSGSYCYILLLRHNIHNTASKIINR